MHMLRGRWQRLQEAVIEVSKAIGSYVLGLGVDEGTALVIQGNKARVVGERKVYATSSKDNAISEADFRIISGSIPGLETPGAYVHGASFNLGEYAMVPVRGKPMDQAISAGR